MSIVSLERKKIIARYQKHTQPRPQFAAREEKILTIEVVAGRIVGTGGVLVATPVTISVTAVLRRNALKLSRISLFSLFVGTRTPPRRIPREVSYLRRIPSQKLLQPKASYGLE